MKSSGRLCFATIILCLFFFIIFNFNNDQQSLHAIEKQQRKRIKSFDDFLKERVSCLDSPFSASEPKHHQAVVLRGVEYRRRNRDIIEFFFVPDCRRGDDADEDGDFQLPINSQEHVLKVTQFLQKNCGWNLDLPSPVFSSSHRFHSGGNYKTNSQLLVPVLAGAGRSSSRCFIVDRNRKNQETDPNQQQHQQQQQQLQVHFLFRQQFGRHMYHSILGPFGLFQIWCVKKEFEEKIIRGTQDENQKRSSHKFRYRVISSSDNDVDGGDEKVKSVTRKMDGNYHNRNLPHLAQQLYSMILRNPNPLEYEDDDDDDDDEHHHHRREGKNGSGRSSNDNFDYSDFVIYGGFGHNVPIGNLFDDTPVLRPPHPHTHEANKNWIDYIYIRNFSSALRAAASASATAVQISNRGTAKEKRSTMIFVEHREFCLEDQLDQFPRLRGIRPELQKFFDEELTSSSSATASEIHRVSFSSSSSSLLHKQESINTLLQSRIFIVSEGAGVIRQLLASPGSTFFIVFDHWHRLPFLRRPAYHTKISLALNHHRIVFVVLDRKSYYSNTSVADFLASDDGNRLKQELRRALHWPTRFEPGLVFVGSASLFFLEGKGSSAVMMNPNGRQDFSVEFSRQGHEETDDSFFLKRALNLTGGKRCFR